MDAPSSVPSRSDRVLVVGYIGGSLLLVQYSKRIANRVSYYRTAAAGYVFLSSSWYVSSACVFERLEKPGKRNKKHKPGQAL
ncbi:hypothetical protein B0I72DRAFT_135967 [Yarrowia lipolytica]|uniref:Uncharacterized protein n=1 Tax=Yarrowia lipolytica TaxID=4952 RepID=A0A371C9B4_YARLL|nr:hypothetical protein BKA91DRAFT_133683 [Yarrowia lipolytica]KAE8174995.1 hypothetical protein BKA90DRAFT_133276 [Yarrowia lipolytica]RDW26895.1 hypothetical protein B0I71DRAFT_130166 [Yarrowia lipolytica]RDW33655.1 hypothetical protein B0I72DRAFT_135967 [Yarrowia lipolytica]RDW39549.1 hypothetical protein B0I73DRAFT_131845 [Yarrowia lipolytica]